MESGGGGPPEQPPQPPSAAAARRSRFIGQQYADITKLRELAARHDRAAARAQQRASRLHTKIERLRHQAAILREKGEKAVTDIPDFEQQIKQYERDIDAATNRQGGAPAGSDVTNLHFRVRKLQQKVVDRQQKARTYELRAATKTQKTAELKVKVDRYLETARTAEQEAKNYRQRADRLQMVSEREAEPALGPPPDAEAEPPSDAEEPPRPP